MDIQHPTHHGRQELRQRLLDDHGRVLELIETVAARIDADDPFGALDVWPAFESGLLRHMNAEEMHVLPHFAEIDPEEAKRLREDHVFFRSELGRLAVCLQLHIARKNMFDDLVSRLLRHASREEEVMYRWAERTLPQRVVDALFRTLAH